MYDFWESVLFGTATFKGMPLVVHRELARHTPLTAETFDHWVVLFQTTVDDLFSGANAEKAKGSAARIAATMSYRVTQTRALPASARGPREPWKYSRLTYSARS